MVKNRYLPVEANVTHSRVAQLKDNPKHLYAQAGKIFFKNQEEQIKICIF